MGVSNPLVIEIPFPGEDNGTLSPPGIAGNPFLQFNFLLPQTPQFNRKLAKYHRMCKPCGL